MKELVTPRLLLRPYQETDAHFLLDMYQRPEVLRFLPKARVDDLAAASEVVAERRRPDPDPMLGWWMTTLADGTPTGTILLLHSRGTTDVEIGWHQHPDHNGNGYTTEAARAVLDHALASGAEFVVALTLEDNVPSQRVCQRLGMRDLGMTDRYYGGALLRLFRAGPT